MNYGSNKPHLQLLSVRVAEICFLSRVHLFPVWISRNENIVAYSLSRCAFEVDCDDWQLQPSWFRYLDATWEPHVVDHFADDRNIQLPIFNSKTFCPGTAGVEAFVCCSTGHNNSFCPAIALILRVLEKVNTDRAIAMLVVP